MLLVQSLTSDEWHIVKELTVLQEQPMELTWEGRPYSTYCRHVLKPRPEYKTANTSVSIVTCKKCLKAWNDSLRAKREVDLIYSSDIVGKYKVEVIEMGCTGCDQYKWLIHDQDGNYISTASGPRTNPEQSRHDGRVFAQKRMEYKNRKGIWRSVIDERTCDYCRSMDGKEITMGEFTTMYDNCKNIELLHVTGLGCRCVMEEIKT